MLPPLFSMPAMSRWVPEPGTPEYAFARAFTVIYAISVGPSVLIQLLKRKKTLLGDVFRTIVAGFRPNGLATSLALIVGGQRLLQKHLRSPVARLYRLAHPHESPEDKRKIDMYSSYTGAAASAFVSICMLQSSTQFAPAPPRKPAKLSVLQATADDFLEFTGNARPRLYLTKIDDPTLKPPYEYSGTLELTLFFLMRAADCAVNQASGVFGNLVSPKEKEAQAAASAPEKPQSKSKIYAFLTKYGSAIAFQLACWRIMYAFFYAPYTLPPAYNLWIAKLARIDPTVTPILRHVHEGYFVYGSGLTESCQRLMTTLAVKGGYDPVVFDPNMHKHVSCAPIHGPDVGSKSCTYDLVHRWVRGFLDCFSIYLPVHAIPALYRHRKRMLKSKEHAVNICKRILKGTVRSTAFLATFIALNWAGVCFARTILPARILRKVFNQQFFEAGPSPTLGAFLSGFSILIESQHRRREMALYVLPRALISLASTIVPRYFAGPFFGPLRIWFERLAFALSAAYMATCMLYNRQLVTGIMRPILDLCFVPEKKAIREASAPAQDSKA